MGRAILRLVQPALGCLLLCGAGFSGSLRAGETPGKITVEGAGTALVKPDVAEIRTTLSGSANLASEAEKKYRDHRRRALELLHQLRFKEMAIEERGPAIAPSVAVNGQQGFVVWNNVVVQGGNQQSTGFNFVEPLVIRLPSIDRMKNDEVIGDVVKILDAAKDAGMPVAGVQFKSTRIEASRTAAIRAAVEAARQKAELLASLSHARVGPILSIQETTPAAVGNDNAQPQVADADEAIALANLNIQAAGMSRLSAIVVRATVNVEFALERGK